MPSITDRLSRAAEALDDRWDLAAVPAVVAFVSGAKFRRLATPVDFHIGVSFATPLPVTTAWEFLSLPSTGGGLTVSPDDLALAVAGAIATALFAGVLGAGYLGSIVRTLDGETLRFGADVRRYLRPILGFELLVAAGSLVVVLAAATVPALLFVVVPATLVVAYLLYPVPYVAVVEDVGLNEAIDRGLAFTREGGEALDFFAGYLLAGAAVSIPATLLFANFGPVGGGVAALALAPVGLVFDTATTAFVREAFGDASAETPAER